MAGNRNYFVDLSSNNAHDGAASFNAATYRRAGHRIVAIKVSEGASYVNPYWAGWAASSIAAGLQVVYYHFASNTAPANQQAVHFASTLKASRLFRPGTDRVFLDVEQGSMLVDPVSFRKDFEATMVTAGFSRLGVYSDAGYFEQWGPGLRPTCGDMWVAALGLPGHVPAGWWMPQWAHQYTFTGRVQGVIGPVDLNLLRRTLFQRIFRKGIA